MLLTRSTPNSSDPDVLGDPGDTNWCSGDHDSPGENMPCASTAFCAPHIGDAHAASRSRHVNGVQVVMADGSVQFVDDSINIDTWRAMATIGGEENQPQF